MIDLNDFEDINVITRVNNIDTLNKVTVRVSPRDKCFGMTISIGKEIVQLCGLADTGYVEIKQHKKFDHLILLKRSSTGTSIYDPKHGNSFKVCYRLDNSAKKTYKISETHVVTYEMEDGCIMINLSNLRWTL